MPGFFFALVAVPVSIRGGPCFARAGSAGSALHEAPDQGRLVKRRQTLKNSPKTRLFFGLIPIPATSFRAVFGRSEPFIAPCLCGLCTRLNELGGAIASRPGSTCRRGRGPQRNPGRLEGQPGGRFFVVFRAVFGNFSGQFLRKFQRVCAGKSLKSRSAQSRRVAIKSRWRLTQRKSRRRPPGISWRCPRRYSRSPRRCSP